MNVEAENSDRPPREGPGFAAGTSAASAAIVADGRAEAGVAVPAGAGDPVPDLRARGWSVDSRSYWQIVWSDFKRHRSAVTALWLVVAMGFIGVVAPLLANARPYFLYLPAAGASSAAGARAGWRFPLFASLSAGDWMLLLGLGQALAAWWAYRHVARRQGAPSQSAAATLFLLSLAPAVLALAFSPAVREWMGAGKTGVAGTLPWPTWSHLREPWVNWSVLAVVAAGGAGVATLGAARLARGRRDALGNLHAGGAIGLWLVGALALLVASSRLGSLGQKRIENIDYIALVRETPGAKAFFPPIPHDFAGTENYMANQKAGAPFVRVQPSGGSNAASDLGLTDERKEVDLAAEVGAPEGQPQDPSAPAGRLTRETPLSALRAGAGLRRHDGVGTDFTVVSHSLERWPVSLHDARTLGDVLDRIGQATGGVVTATISADGKRLELHDSSEPRPRHWMGTDDTGSDVAARLIHATRVALSIGFVSTGIALAIGIVVGALMGYFGGWVDMLGSRVIEIFMAIPRLFLLLTIIAFIPPAWNDHLLYAMMVIIGLTSWMSAARFIRAEYLRLRHQDFVQAAQAVGLPMRSILFKHMLPNGVTPVLVDASFGVAAAIFIETGLSFLGFGIKPPNPSWGHMLSKAVNPATGLFYWWLAVFPGIMIFLTVFSFNLIGDALRDAIDPKLKKAAAI